MSDGSEKDQPDADAQVPSFEPTQVGKNLCQLTYHPVSQMMILTVQHGEGGINQCIIAAIISLIRWNAQLAGIKIDDLPDEVPQVSFQVIHRDPKGPDDRITEPSNN